MNKNSIINFVFYSIYANQYKNLKKKTFYKLQFVLKSYLLILRVQ